MKFTCIKSGGKLVWNKGVTIKKSSAIKAGICPPKAAADLERKIGELNEYSIRKYEQDYRDVELKALAFDKANADIDQIMSEQNPPLLEGPVDIEDNSSVQPSPRSSIPNRVNSSSSNSASANIKNCPLVIPSRANVIYQQKVGYTQQKYTWTNGKYKYEARWHTRTPNAPESQGNTWVVMRTLPGAANGSTPKKQWILIGKYKWVDKSIWDSAVRARQNGTATIRY